MKSLIVFLAFFVGCAVARTFTLAERTFFMTWRKANPTRVYRSLLEEQTAMEELLNNRVIVDAYNADCKINGCPFLAALWSNSDWSDAKKEINLCGSEEEEVMELRTAPQTSYPVAGNLLYKNWVTEGRVLPVVDQQSCGSCWSFAAAGAAEGLFKKQDPLFNTPLSPQRNVDCDSTNLGCNGGNSYKALEHMRVSGISTLANYPYKNIKGTCNTSAAKVTKKITTAYIIQVNGDENLLRDIVFSQGPVAISMHVANMFYKYSSGVFNNATCINTSTNHAMLLVGYGSEVVNTVKMDYWLVKNSWGTTWGEQGYIKMRRNANNQCGIARFAYYAV